MVREFSEGNVADCDVNNNNFCGDRKPVKMVVPKRSDVTPHVKMASTPGYLELSAEKMERLICHTPIEEMYEVEEQPFARGKFAAVRRCRHRVTGQQFAAKVLKKHRRAVDLRPEILHEVAILDACAASTRIVRLHQVFESQCEMVLLLELAPGGELQMLLDNDEIPDEHQVKKMMRQILDGLIYLHSINVAHLDLKPQNIVLTSEYPECEVKLCDLGISRYISDGADIKDILGTPDYVAPEVLNYERISLATDMWSVGVLLYVLLTGCSPFGGDTKQETFCNISQCTLDFPDELFEDITEDAIDLMKKLMVKDPSDRLSAQQCLEHRWFAISDPETPASPLLRHEEVRMSPSPQRKSDVPPKSPKHKAPVETSLIEKSTDFHTPEILITKPDTLPPVAAPTLAIKPDRKEKFRRGMSELAERLSAVDMNVKDEPKTSVPVYPPKENTMLRLRKSISMLSLPTGNPINSHSNLNFNPNEVKRRSPTNRECLYSFRKCIVIEDDIDISPPMSIAGSVTSSVASDQSISDSGSEVSELSIDSSSDRSSIISLDDSVEYNTRTGRYTSHVWRQGGMKSTNDAFASAFRRFSNCEELDRKDCKITTTPRRPASRAYTVLLLNKSLGLGTPGTAPKVKLEARKERSGDQVVIREVRAGKYVSVRELKCESVKKRITKFEVSKT